MFRIYEHPAFQYGCRHCGANTGYDPEMCFNCGPICTECFMADEYPCDERGRAIESDNPIWQQILDEE